jgi:hypothetical protein
MTWPGHNHNTTSVKPPSALRLGLGIRDGISYSAPICGPYPLTWRQQQAAAKSDLGNADRKATLAVNDFPSEITSSIELLPTRSTND